MAQYGATPIVRIPVASEALVKRALDSGAHGIMTPMCHTADDARAVVAWNKYPPRGTRGFGPMFAGASFGLSEGEYATVADDSCLVMVQIESRAGVENVEEIARVEGLDVLFIGESEARMRAARERGQGLGGLERMQRRWECKATGSARWPASSLAQCFPLKVSAPSFSAARSLARPVPARTR